ncbi:MAG TPA: M23 family metallopeptidase [Candidatus Thiothrix moscowensis]|uniref:M23 family metallopeptidase n=1 Tax=unclassified Thiothrix TaxID=2636184 RepID=UPI0025FCBF14|nr:MULTISPECIES: M23 family metallopeptidase [unclassified Thiothrix]HRJ53969.1 M23 family metallopeptidase [Candidatus Thiothrix moscowensis]HRJ94051.1 M23 family metallopeptidase [Candidatus Thiothrix moscowensis]
MLTQQVIPCETLELAKNRYRQLKRLHENWEVEIVGDSPPFSVVATPPEDQNDKLNSTYLCFPFLKRPDDSIDYHVGCRKFGADRNEGRKHAGCDLIAPPGTKIFAMADGVVIRGPYCFYDGTYALEVESKDGVIIRYCEISCDLPAGVEQGKQVIRGQFIARVGQLNSGRSMLHLEMYKGTANGKLTQPGTVFERRSDLIDPTNYLDDSRLLI